MKRVLAATALLLSTVAITAVTSPPAAASGELRRVGLPFLWPKAGVYDISATGPSDVWVSGVQGAFCIPQIASFGCVWRSGGNPVVRRWDGARWREYALPGWSGDTGMHTVAAAAPDDVWVSATQLDPPVQYLAHFDGTAFTKIDPPVAGTSFDVFANASGTWLTTSEGDTPLYRRTGDSWQPAQGTGMSVVADVQARTATDAWAVGSAGPDRRPAVAHWDGESWQPVPFTRDDPRLTSVLPVAADEVWATVRQSEYVVRWNGSTWSQVDLPNGQRHFGLAMDGSGTLWAGGEETKWVDGYIKSHPVLMSYDDGTWQRTPVPMPWGADEMGIIGLTTVPGTGALWIAANSSTGPAVLRND